MANTSVFLPYYLNQRRVTNLVGANVIEFVTAKSQIGMNDKLRSNILLTQYAKLLRDWYQQHAELILPFELLMLQGKLKPGTFFLMHHDFYCRGFRSGNKQSAVMYTKVPYGDEMHTLKLKLHSEHLVPGSPGELLTGRVASAFVIASIEDTNANETVAVPLFVGRLAEGYGQFDFHDGWTNLELFVDSFDSFAAVRDELPSTRKELEFMRTVLEEDVKVAVAEIIGEEDVSKDWGGEQSDLFTTHMRYQEERRSAAFLFKGRAKPHPMTVADLGKNGDQIDRLYKTPADVLFVQHCDQITPAVRSMLRAYCNQPNNIKRFCLVDGNDTHRLLRAYSKCGLSPRKRRQDSDRRSQL